MSSSGEMKMSLKLIIYHTVRIERCARNFVAHVFVSQMFEEFQFSVCSLGEDGGAEGLHNLLDRHSLVGELILRRTATMLVLRLLPLLSNKHTRRDQKRPCRRAADRYIFMEKSVQRIDTGCVGCVRTCSLSQRSYQRSGRARILP
jgi:hypothetical protein